MSNEQSAQDRESERTARERDEAATEDPGAAGGGATAAGEDEQAGEGARAERQAAGEGPEAGRPQTEGAVEPEDPQAEIERLRKALEEAEAKANEYHDRLLRKEAEKENVRKRAEKDAESARKAGIERMANELLAVRDSLELGVDAANQEDADVAKVREGTELTLRMLVQVMEKFNIEEINPVGERFNPDLHQAMSMQEIDGYESNTVVSVMQKGYRLGDRLLRPALVTVAK